MPGDFDFDSEDKPEIENFNTKKFKFSLAPNTSRKLSFKVTIRNGSNVRPR